MGVTSPRLVRYGGQALVTNRSVHEGNVNERVMQVESNGKTCRQKRRKEVGQK